MTSIRSRGPLGLLLVAAIALPLSGLMASPAVAEDAPALEEHSIPWVLDFNAAKAQACTPNRGRK